MLRGLEGKTGLFGGLGVREGQGAQDHTGGLHEVAVGGGHEGKDIHAQVHGVLHHEAGGVVLGIHIAEDDLVGSLQGEHILFTVSGLEAFCQLLLGGVLLHRGVGEPNGVGLILVGQDVVDALLGQLIVYITYYPHYKETEDAEAILGTFCTTDADNQKVNYFLNEMFGTLVLVFGALCCLSLAWGKQDYAAASIVVGFIVWGLVTSMGGPTGPGLNPARDLMPRLLHAILPIPHKGSSRWGEAWIPVVAPIVGAIIGAWLFVFFFAS